MKNVLKALANFVAQLIILPLFGAYCLGSLFLGAKKAFPGWSQAFSLLPGLTGVYLRRAFYRWAFPRCGRDTVIGFGTVFSHPTAQLGNQVYIGVHCCLGDVTLEDDVLVASHVCIANGGQQHGIERLDIPIREQPGTWPRIIVGRDSWIGDRSVVLANIGKHCVIGAGSVVTRAIPDYAIAVGSPARVVRYRNDNNNDFEVLAAVNGPSLENLPSN
jgi:acetyltransferase-like isoleucine patch superfamily enzyme